ncbi:hypothetical protein D3C81_1575380 [compost metagenome]
MHQQRFERIDITVGARNDTPGARLVEVAHRQRLHMGKYLHPQVIEHADRRTPGNELRHARQQEAPQPAGRQTQAQPQHQAFVQQPVIGAGYQTLVEQLAHEPGPQEHSEHQQQFDADHRQDLPANGPQQRQQTVEHATVQGLARQVLLDLDIAGGLVGCITHGRSLAGRGSGHCSRSIRHGCHWR